MQTQYYWRVRVDNICGNSPFSPSFNFVTSSCVTYVSTNIPLNVPNNTTVTSTINIPSTGIISDVNVLDLTGSHGRVGQLTISLASPSATSSTLFSGICGNDNDFDLNFDDDATPGAIPCPPTTSGTYQPQNALGAFNGEDPQGTWTLSVNDASAPTTGTLLTWSIEVCLTSCDLTATTKPYFTYM